VRTGALREVGCVWAEREWPVIDGTLHHDGGGEPLHAGQGGERLVAQGSVRGKIGGGDAQQAVRVAEQLLRVPDLRDGGERRLELGDGGGVLAAHCDADEDLESEIDRGHQARRRDRSSGQPSLAGAIVR
jgi:hypothetical protein